MKISKKMFTWIMVFAMIVIFIAGVPDSLKYNKKIKGHAINLNADVDIYRSYRDFSTPEEGDTVMLIMHELEDRQWILWEHPLQKDTSYIDVWAPRHRGPSKYPTHKVHIVKAVIVKR